jgi:hypothetical protein
LLFASIALQSGLVGDLDGEQQQTGLTARRNRSPGKAYPIGLFPFLLMLFISVVIKIFIKLGRKLQ